MEENIEKNIAPKNKNMLALAVCCAGIIVAVAILFKDWDRTDKVQIKNNQVTKSENYSAILDKEVLPSEGVELPVVWSDLGARLVSVGVVDDKRLKAIYEERGTFTAEYQNLLTGANNGKLKIDESNSGYILNLLWALGLANSNSVLDEGEMADPKYGGAGRFASTGGWTLSKDNPMDHYSKHKFFKLTSEQQALVDKVSRGVYRPCCNNSTHFPDCNHGMAMLGLLELMASQNASEKDMWKTALIVNSYWFPNTYLTIAKYMKEKGIDWRDVDPQEVLGFEYSSASGSSRITSQIEDPEQKGGGGGCSV
ncbi:MAG: hypothetical protein Q7R78_02620 [bacterium]|nr:hypothetical protein [bacterium]